MSHLKQRRKREGLLSAVDSVHNRESRINNDRCTDQ